MDFNALMDVLNSRDVVPADETFYIEDLNVVSTANVSIATITAVIQGQLVAVSGDSRRYLDKPNPTIGELLAISRALSTLARKVEKRANGLVRQAEHNAQIRPVQRTKAIEWAARNAKPAKTTKSRTSSVPVKTKKVKSAVAK